MTNEHDCKGESCPECIYSYNEEIRKEATLAENKRVLDEVWKIIGNAESIVRYAHRDEHKRRLWVDYSEIRDKINPLRLKGNDEK